MTTADERRKRTWRGRHDAVLIRDAFTHYTRSGKVKKTFLSEISAEVARPHRAPAAS